MLTFVNTKNTGLDETLRAAARVYFRVRRSNPVARPLEEGAEPGRYK